MSKICFFISDINHAGGTERVTNIIANNIASKNNEVMILSLSGGDAPFFEFDNNIKLHSLFKSKISMKKNGISGILKLRNFVAENKIDTLIVVDSILCVFSVPALMFLKTKHICWEHFNFNVSLGVNYRKFGRILAARYCDYIVTLTKKDKQLWENGIKKIKAKIIPIPNPSPFKDIENLPSLQSKTILSIGRLTYQKGFDLLIEAWALICEKNPGWVLKIVGGGEDEIKLKQIVKQKKIDKYIEFVGQTKNIDFYYKNSAIYCMSSRFEGLPMVLLEAQSYGLPIIAFDCDTGPSELIQQGVNGILVKEFNINILACEIDRFINMNDKIYFKFVENAKKNNKNYFEDNIINFWLDII